MTAHAVGSPSAVSASSMGAKNTSAQASTSGFADQLHAARERGGAAAQEQGAARHASPEPVPAAARGKHPAPPRSEARHADIDAGRPARSGNPAPVDGGPASDLTVKTPPVTNPPSPPVSIPATPLLAETVASVASNEAAPADKDTDDNHAQDGAVLVGAMLALVGPAASKVLPLGAAGLPATSAKSVTADAGAAALLLSGGDAASVAVTTNLAASAVPAPWLAVDELPLSPRDLRDFARIDAPPTLVLSAPTLAAPSIPVSAPVLVPASPQAFAQELGQQVTWFVDQGIKQARIRLHPEEMGSLELKISVNHGRVDVVFHAQHPGAVAAVQQSLPQLDQMLAQHGLSLGNTEVGQHDRGDQSGHAGRGDRSSEIDEVHGSGVVTPLSQLGLLDAFA